MLDIYKNKDKKATTAVINNSSFDAIVHIAKKLGIRPDCDCKASLYRALPYSSSALMSDKYSGTVKCNGEDEYNEKVGTDEAVKKAMSNHKKGFTRAIIRWQASMIKVIMDVSPKTFDTALKKVHKCSCCKED